MAKDDIYLFNKAQLKGIMEVLTQNVNKDNLSAFWKNAHAECLFTCISEKARPHCTGFHKIIGT